MAFEAAILMNQSMGYNDYGLSGRKVLPRSRRRARTRRDRFKDAKIVDSYVYRAPGAVSWFSPGSYSSRPPLVVPGFRNSLVCAGDWVRMGQKETRAKGLCQERAFICGLEAGNALLDELKDGGRRHPVLPIREDEPQVVLGRAANRQLQELLKPLGLDSFWVR